MSRDARTQLEPATLQADVASLIREVAAQAIMPRFRQLASADVKEKTPGEVVTIADLEAEAILTKGLQGLLPDARVIGEEACALDPSILHGLDKGTVWLVDPLDGTANFAGGREPFGIIVALAREGTTVAAWLYDPVSDRMHHAEIGAGAFVTERGGLTRQLVTPAVPSRPVAALATQFMPDELRNAIVRAASRSFDLRPIPRCAAEHYPRLCRGENHFAVFQRTLPWDHAAGALLLTEAGGCVTRWDGSDYLFHDGGLGIIAATHRALLSCDLSEMLREDATTALAKNLLVPKL